MGPHGVGRAFGQNPAFVAQRFLGEVTARSAWRTDMPEARAHPEKAHVLCATFVSAMLRETGLLPHRPDTHGLTHPRQLEAKLLAEGWQQVSLRDARPGDVVLYERPPLDHVELLVRVLSLHPPVALTVGSNNVDGPGRPQRVTLEQRNLRTWAEGAVLYRPPR